MEIFFSKNHLHYYQLDFFDYHLQCLKLAINFELNRLSFRTSGKSAERIQKKKTNQEKGPRQKEVREEMLRADSSEMEQKIGSQTEIESTITALLR